MVRGVYDHYPTPKKHVLDAANLITVFDKPTVSILDVGCGNGVWGDVFSDRFSQKGVSSNLTGIDIQNFSLPDNYNNRYMGFDFNVFGTENNLGLYDFIISNPPFKYAQSFIEKSFDLLENDGKIIMLLRLSFLESQKRKPFFETFKPQKIVVMSKRPSFTGNGKTDSAAYAFYVWKNGFVGETILDWVL